MKDVTAAIIERDGNVLIARRRRDDRQGDQWEFPGGTVEAGETREACLSREMAEELGIEASVGPCLGESIYRYDHGAIRLIAFRVHWTGKDPVPRVHDRIRWVPRKDLRRYDFSPADLPFVDMLLSGAIDP